MSVSLTMIPVALALRVVMGKDRFNEWVESSQQPQISNFKSKRELTSIVQLAGYDAIPYGSSIKTHFNEKDFFFWELRDGQWVAIFTQYDSRQQIETFIRKLNEAANRNVFSNEQPEQIKRQENGQVPLQKAVFPTNFSNIDLLERVLQENAIPTSKLAGGTLVSQLQSAELHFIQHRPEGVIDVEVKDPSSMKNIFRQLNVLDENYRKQLQQETYTKVMEQADAKGFTVEEEMILPDESILLTLRVGR